MRKYSQPIITVFLLLFLSSCSHYFYIPNSHNVPLFQEKGETRLSTTIINEVQVAYAITNHVGVIANGFYVPFGKNYHDDDGSGYLIEGGAGYFTKLNKRWVFESYAGYGAGNVQNKYYERDFGFWSGFGEPYYAGRSIMNINRAFLQPSIGYTNTYLDCALSARFVGIWYTNIRTYDVPDDFFYANDMELMRKNMFTQFEPAFTVRAGWKYIKLQGQAGLSFNLNHPQFRYSGYNFNLGLYLSLADKFKSKKP